MKELDKEIYEWLFRMFGFCPVQFVKILCSVILGQNNRQCVIVIYGDVHCGKSLLIAILKRVFKSAQFQNLDDLNTLMAYAEGCDCVCIDDVTEYDMKLLNNNRGLLARERVNTLLL